jgi:asparaginyl-tRNA synthetase
MAKKKQSMEFLREKAHLRPRTNTIGAVARIRNALAFATHKFFNENGFYYVHTPIITASDCEGAGEMFQVGCWGARGCVWEGVPEARVPARARGGGCYMHCGFAA